MEKQNKRLRIKRDEENKIKIKKVYPRYVWRWKVKEDCCLICQQEFNAVCNECTHPIRCVPMTGACGHTFHKHCFEEWSQTNTNCPICRVVFKVSKMYEIPKYFDVEDFDTHGKGAL